MFSICILRRSCMTIQLNLFISDNKTAFQDLLCWKTLCMYSHIMIQPSSYYIFQCFISFLTIYVRTLCTQVYYNRGFDNEINTEICHYTRRYFMSAPFHNVQLQCSQYYNRLVRITTDRKFTYISKFLSYFIVNCELRRMQYTVSNRNLRPEMMFS